MVVYHVHVEVVRTIVADSKGDAARKVEAEIDALPTLERVGNTTDVWSATPDSV